MELSLETFRSEMEHAILAFDRFIVCLDKPPDDFKVSLESLMTKAIKAYVGRQPTLRHGIALDRQVTIILSQTESERPLCGIYFNLSSPYHKTVKRADDTPSEAGS